MTTTPRTTPPDAPTGPSSTTPAVPATPADAQAAAQAALAGEHACVYAYGVVGAHLDEDAADTARAALAAHRSRRDALSTWIRADGGRPDAGFASYALPTPVTDDATARGLAAELEHRLGSLLADLVAASDDPALRELAARGLVDTALRAMTWSGTASPAFPGLDGRPGTPGGPGPSPSPPATSPSP